MTKLEARIGYTFRNPEWLQTALTHSSFWHENREKSRECNERLEFLGDSVLGFLTAEYLFENNPELSEGELTRRRAALVCEASLARAARTLAIGEHLLLGKGEEKNGGRQRSSVLADATEALLAALYMGGGLEAARCFARMHVLADSAAVSVFDAKSRLQEWAQRKPSREITYRLVEQTGPDHDKRFQVEVCLNGQAVGIGEGGSKKEAEQNAAGAALRRAECGGIPT